MILTDDPIVRCDECGNEIKIDKDVFDEDAFSVGEFGMGDRVEYDFRCEIDCPACSNQLAVTIRGFEYPVGAFEYQDSEAEGCEVLYEPPLEIEYFPDEVLSVYEEILRNPKYVYQLDSYEFENFVADVFRQNGFHAEVTQKTRDGGKDIVATFEMGGVLYNTYFECKQYSPNRPVGVDIIDRLYGVMERDGVDKGVIVTTSYFTRDAIQEAKRFSGRIQLVDFNKLQELMRTTGRRYQEY